MTNGVSLRTSTHSQVQLLQRHIKSVRSGRRVVARQHGVMIHAAMTAAAVLMLVASPGAGMTRVQARTPRVPPRSMIVATPPGAMNTVLQDVLWKPYGQESRERIVTAPWNGVLTSLEPVDLAKRAGNWSLMLVEEDSAQTGCANGLFQSIPATTESAGPTPDTATSCAAPALSLDFALTWDKSRFQGTPGWADFWDVARHPGKRGLRLDPRGTLEAALLADGVPPDLVYRELDSQGGLDRAFRRLSQLRPYIAWWRTPAEAMRILTSGAALMGMAPTTDVLAANESPAHTQFGVLWAPVLRVSYDWVIPAGTSANPTKAQTLQSWASAPEQQASLNARLRSAGKTDTGTTLPSEPKSAHFLALNTAFWRDHLPAIQARFVQWLEEQH